MRLGTWREVNLPAYGQAALWAAGLAAIIVATPPELLWLALGPLLAGALAAMLIRSRGGASRLDETGQTRVPHPGPNSRRIPVSGFPGLVLVFGFAWMFWFGVPGFRPIVVGVAFVGGLAGIVFIWTARRRPLPPSEVLNLHTSPTRGDDRPEHHRLAAEQGDEADKATPR